MNTALPVTAPVPGLAAFLAATPATGVPASTFTVTVRLAVFTPLLATSVNVSVVAAVAVCRCAALGV